MSPKISVVVPVYNVEAYIRECVDSIISQTIKELEIILIDDGSSDESGKILDDYEIKDKRIKVIHQKNAGVSAARNTGIDVCMGDYIYVMDSDDYLEKRALEEMYNNAVETGADVIISDHYTFQESAEHVPHHFFPKEFITDDHSVIMKIQNMVLHKGYSPYLSPDNNGLGIGAPWTKLLKRELVIDNQLHFDSYVQGIFDDGLFCLNILQYSKKVSYIKFHAYNYRILQSSLIHRFNPKRIEIDRKIFQRIKEFEERYRKDALFTEAFYGRIVLYTVHLFRVYFFNSKYEGSLWGSYRDLKRLLKSEPYKSAFENANSTKFKEQEERFVTLLVRHHLYFVIWLIFLINKIRKRRG